MVGIKGKSGKYIRTKEHKTNISLSNIGKRRSNKFKIEQSKRTSNFFKTERGKKQIERLKKICKNCPTIHHINGNHFDNRPENRMIVTPREHALIHMLQGGIKPYGWRCKK